MIRDLDERGLLNRTLVILASEFSRDMMIEGVPGSMARDQSRAKTDVMKEMKHYGLHRHFTGSGSVLMFGGGMKRGFLYGETAAERPCLVTKNPVTIPGLARHDLLGHGHFAAGLVGRGKAAVLRDRRRQRKADSRVVCLAAGSPEGLSYRGRRIKRRSGIPNARRSSEPPGGVTKGPHLREFACISAPLVCMGRSGVRTPGGAS